MDDEDGRCLLDVICDPQALNDFLHGSDKGQIATVGEGNTNQIQSNTSCVDLSFLEDDILGSPANSSVQQNSDEPCDILQQSLQEANITQQTLQEEADLAANVLQVQPYSQLHSATEETLQLFGGGSTELGGLAQQQPPAIITQQPLLQQPVNTQFVNKTISVQRLIQQVGLNSIAITPIASIQTRSNGSPRRTSSIGQIQMVDQHAGQTAMMSIGQHHPQLITKSGQSAQMTTLPPGSYLSTSGVDQQLTINSSISSQFQKNVSATNLNGNSLFANVTQASQQVTVRPTGNNQAVHTPVSTQNIIQKTPSIQPKHRVNIQPKLIQISPKPSFSPNSSTLQTALKLQTETALKQQKAQQNLTFVAGTPGQNVLLSTQGPTVAQSIATNLIKQPPQQVQPNVGKPVSVQVLNQGGSIVIQPQSLPQAVIPGTNQFIVPGQLTNTSGVTVPHQLSAIPGGSILTAQSTATPNLPGQAATTHIIGRQVASGQLVTSQSLPAQILTAQNVAGQLTNFSQVFAAPNAQLAVGQGTTHILSGPLQLQPSQLAQSTLFQIPAQLSGNFPAKSRPSSQPTLVQQGQTIVQGVPVPNQITVLNNTGQLGQSMNVQQSGVNSSIPNIVQQQPSSDAEQPMGNGQPPLLMIQQAQIQPQSQPQPQTQSRSQSGDIQQPVQLSAATPSNTVPEHSEKVIINQQGMGPTLNADQLLLFQQKEQKQQLLYQQALKLQQEKGLSLTSSNGLAAPITANSMSGSVLVSSGIGSAIQTNSILMPASTVLMESKNRTVLPQLQPSHFQPALASQSATVVAVDGKVLPDSSARTASPQPQGKVQTIHLKPLVQPQLQSTGQAMPSMISNISGLNVTLGKGPIQIQVVGKGIARIAPVGSIQTALFQGHSGNLKRPSPTTRNRRDLLLEQFCKDQNAFMQPDSKTAFKTFEDTVFSLLPYHVCKGTLPAEEDFKKVDDEFEAVSAQLLKRTQTMLNKYRLLLFEESRRAKPSAEMVMIDRMFIQDEKVALVEAKQLAREHPDAYISSVFKPSTLPLTSCSSAASTDLVQSSTQISATKLVIKQTRNSPSVNWATGSPSSNSEIDVLLSRSKPLKTYVASSRGGLKLKIKHEAGYSKVVHNTALDQLSPPVMSSLSEKSPSNLPVKPLSQSNGNVNCLTSSPAEKRQQECLNHRAVQAPKDYLNSLDGFTQNEQDSLRSSPNLVPDQSKRISHTKNSCGFKRSIKYEVNQKAAIRSGGMKDSPRSLVTSGRTEGNGFPNLIVNKTEVISEELLVGKMDDSTSNLMKELAAVEDALTQGLMKIESVDEVPDLHWELPLPQPKRRKSDSVDNASFSSDSPQDSTLNEHLQSAINSILDLQRLQHSSEEQTTTNNPTDSAELDIPQFSPMASSEDFIEPETHGGLVGAGTSTLEEAVNSILDD